MNNVGLVEKIKQLIMKKRTIKKTENHRNKNLKIYELLGAKQFKKVVLKVEQIKYRITKPFLKKIISWHEKRVEKEALKVLSSARTEGDLEKIMGQVPKEKMFFRKERYNKQNRNYHFGFGTPEQTLEYLKQNKQIHVSGIKGSIILSILSFVIAQICVPLTLFATIIFLFEMIQTIVHFECINLQNYNIARIEPKLERLNAIRERKLENKYKKYGQATQVIGTLIQEKQYIPTTQDIISNLTSKELEQLKKMIEETMKEKQEILEGGKKL